MTSKSVHQCPLSSHTTPCTSYFPALFAQSSVDTQFCESISRRREHTNDTILFTHLRLDQRNVFAWMNTSSGFEVQTSQKISPHPPCSKAKQLSPPLSTLTFCFTLPQSQWFHCPSHRKPQYGEKLMHTVDSHSLNLTTLEYLNCIRLHIINVNGIMRLIQEWDTKFE